MNGTCQQSQVPTCSNLIQCRQWPWDILQAVWFWGQKVKGQGHSLTGSQNAKKGDRVAGVSYALYRVYSFFHYYSAFSILIHVYFSGKGLHDIRPGARGFLLHYWKYPHLSDLAVILLNFSGTLRPLLPTLIRLPRCSILSNTLTEYKIVKRVYLLLSPMSSTIIVSLYLRWVGSV